MLFTTSTCPKCPEATKWMKEHYPNTKIMIADEDDMAMQLAHRYNIMCVPAIVEVNVDNSFIISSFDRYKNKGEN